ncbi:MAG TPA: hypothetical protein VHY58_02570 [Streptosporangiaceae bacterium]|jgi:hypothetical protein|nr:hypothetical protein [Streptosporangiaceae bacterium]
MLRGLMITMMAAGLMIGAVPGASASTTSWTIQPTPTPADGVNGQLQAVSCLSAASCTAVGNYESDAGTVTLVEVWDGSAWTVQTSPNPSGANFSDLTGVSCSSATSCTAVGDYTLSGSGSMPLAEHWDGSTWALQSVPSPSGAISSFLDAVSCPSATSCTAVGNSLAQTRPEPTLAEYWNGSTWTIQSTPIPAPQAGSDFLRGVSCTAPDKCTAVGWFQRPGINNFVGLTEQHYGSRWRFVSARGGSSAITGQLNGVSCTAKNNCTLVGTNGNGAALAEHWDGTGWTAQTTPSPASIILTAVSCATATGCTSVGYSPTAGYATVAERYYQGTWRTQPTGSPNSPEELLGLSCVSASTCTAVGTYTRADNPLAESN